MTRALVYAALFVAVVVVVVWVLCPVPLRPVPCPPCPEDSVAAPETVRIVEVGDPYTWAEIRARTIGTAGQ